MGNETFIYPDGEVLRYCGHNYTSQAGEDGYIAAALEQIGSTNKWCFEVGATDGLFFSNTKHWRDMGWNAVLIESDPLAFDKLLAYRNPPRVVCLHRRVVPAGMDSLDCILRDHRVPLNLDLGVIDIDGQDYYVWEGMIVFRPRLMLVEYSPYGSPDDLPAVWGEGQAGLNPILALGNRKGYLPLVRTACNVLFARADIWQQQ